MTLDMEKILPNDPNTTTTKMFNSPRRSWYQTASIDHAHPVHQVHSVNSNSISEKVTSIPDVKRYNWSEFEKGLILGSFYLSYITFQIPLGILSERFGGKWILFASVTFSAVISSITPSITDHIVVLIFLRILLGAAQSGTFPSSYAIQVKWMVEKDRPLAFCLMDGSGLGSFASFMSSGFIIEDYGWPMVFYLSGFMAVIASMWVLLFLRSSPQGCSFVSGTEKELIRKGQTQVSSNDSYDSDGNKYEKKELTKIEEKVPIPWKKILSSKPVLGIMLFRFTHGWNYFMVATEIPNYLNQIVHESTRANGSITAFTQVASFVSALSGGYLAEKIIEREWVERTNCRKLFALISGLGTGLCMFLIPMVGKNHSILVGLLITSSSLSGFRTGADLPIAAELSIRFPTTLYAMFSIVAASTGMLVPYLVGFVLDSLDHSYGWNLLFVIAGGLSVLGSTVFCLFASSKRQPFDFAKGESPDCNNPHIKLEKTLS